MRKLRVVVGVMMLLVIALLITGWGILWANVREITTPPADLLAAQARWTANPIKHYRLKIQHTWALGAPCLQDVEVIDEVVIKTFEDTCITDSRLHDFRPFGVSLIFGSTINELFAKFQTETTRLVFLQDLACGVFLGVTVTYAVEGYPTSAKYDWVTPSPQSLGPNTYLSMYGDGLRISQCLLDALLPFELEIQISLQALP